MKSIQGGHIIQEWSWFFTNQQRKLELALKFLSHLSLFIFIEIENFVNRMKKFQLSFNTNAKLFKI